MYPKPEDDLRGWNIKAFGVGYNHNVVHADESVIAWGSACLSGELGFGDGGAKSSSRPKKVDTLEGVTVAQVACNLASTIMLVKRDAKVRPHAPSRTRSSLPPRRRALSPLPSRASSRVSPSL